MSTLVHAPAAPAFERVVRGPLVTWRVFRVGTDGETLRGVAHKVRWPAGAVMVATCEKTGHAAPQLDCTCGLHGWASLRDALAQDRNDDDVIAMVALWGRCVVHSDGVRAEHGFIVGLLQESPAYLHVDRYHRIAARYGVPLFAFEGGTVNAPR
ncbi:MAG: hypothetical protein AB7L13_23875 [Acidimicrobiia bacterium]